MQFLVGAALGKVKVEGVVVDASFPTSAASTIDGPNGQRIHKMTIAEMDRSLLCSWCEKIQMASEPLPTISD